MGAIIEEQETLISWSRGDESAEVYTTDTTTMTRLDKLCENNPDIWSISCVDTVNGEIYAKTYKCPRKMISFRSKAPTHNGGGNTAGLERYREEQRPKKLTEENQEVI
jgi:hypothetical protein